MAGPGAIHDPARPSPLGRGGVHRVPGGNARRGHPAPEHARVFYKHRGSGSAVRGRDHRRRYCCWPSAPRGSPPSRTRWPTATRWSGWAVSRRGAVGGGAYPGRARRTGTPRLYCHLDVILRLADGAGLAQQRRPGLAGTRNGCSGWSASCAGAGSAGAWSSPAGGVRAAPALGPADLLAAVSELDRRIGTDLRVLTGTASFLDRLRHTGPLPPERAGPGARHALGSRSAAPPGAPTTRGWPGPTTDTLALAVRTASRSDGERAGPAGRPGERRSRKSAFHLLRQAADELAGPARATGARTGCRGQCGAPGAVRGRGRA